MSNDALADVYGSLLVVRPPVPATVNKAGANYKSEVAHSVYYPREAYDEWLAICEAIVACGGDALFSFESADDDLLDAGSLRLAADGTLTAVDSNTALSHIDHIDSGRVFTANGPWVTLRGRTLRAVMPNMLAHRRNEVGYYRQLLTEIASSGGYELEVTDNPHRWEGMADVAAVGDQVVLTYTVAGHYDADVARKSLRSTRQGCAFAVDHAGIDDSKCIFAELVYPHFHGDTVHFGARPCNREPVLVHYAGGLWGDFATQVKAKVGADNIVGIDRADAVDHYAGNSRQVRDGVLVPKGVSPAFATSLHELGLATHYVALSELFGKAGGGPACATLYLPDNIELAADCPLRYSVQREHATARRSRYPEQLTVDPKFFAGRQRG